jgi:DNA repair protein RecN (Recombination protein N)
MLTHLSIRDIVLIDRLDLAFDRGLAVLTGETGAGKSILLDAFALALGARGDGSLVRQGEAQGQVTAVFQPDDKHPVFALLSEQTIAHEGEIILRRVQMADGKTRALVNDQPVSVQTLRAIGSSLVEIHGQHDDRALADPASHRAILDSFAGNEKELTALRKAHLHWSEARDTLRDHQTRLEAARKEADFLRHACDELSALEPEEGEETKLADRRQAMMAAEKASGEIREALDIVGGSSSPIPTLLSVQRRLERRGTENDALLGPAIRELSTALDALEETRSALEAAERAADFDPRELERAEERLFALRAASRKYHVPVDQLASLAERYAADVEALDQSETSLVKLEAALKEAEDRYIAAAQALSKKRAKAAVELEKAVMGELPPLKLERAKFIVALERDDKARGPDGFDHIEFWVETNPGSRPGPMMKVASGGELSRFMLALKVSLADRGSAPTLVFDEIDTGVGGAVADAIGQRLSRLAKKTQVLSVTHAPQVAARASTHLLIAKGESGKGKRIATRVVTIDDAHRREEIARMLSGAEITEEARAAAKKLIEAAK